MKNLICITFILFAGMLAVGCGSLHESYVDADQATYEYAQPKLEAWAQMKKEAGDAEWESIVKDKGISWKARIKRAKEKLKEEATEE